MSDPIKYMVSNWLTESGVSLVLASQSTVYPPTNVFDGELANPMLFPTAGTNVVIIDLGAARTFDHVLIGGHTLNSGCTFVVKADNAAVPTTVVATPAWNRRYIAAAVGTITARYISITITGVLADETIGEIAAHTLITLPGAWVLGRNASTYNVQIVQRTRRNVKHTYDLTDFDKMDYSFRFTAAADLDTFRAFHRLLQGMTTSFWLVESISLGRLWYGRKEASFEPVETDEHSYLPRFLYRLIFEEDSMGSFVDR